MKLKKLRDKILNMFAPHTHIIVVDKSEEEWKALEKYFNWNDVNPNDEIYFIKPDKLN